MQDESTTQTLLSIQIGHSSSSSKGVFSEAPGVGFYISCSSFYCLSVCSRRIGTPSCVDAWL